jgi:5-methyltetrahydropteroyltriglutamate--homocysteine methyltransferase
MNREVIAELKAAGASWIQFDEPTLVLDLDSSKLAAFTAAYTELEAPLAGLNVLVETYFADIPAESYKYVIYFTSTFLQHLLISFIRRECSLFFCNFRTLTSLNSVTAYGFDLVRGTQTLELIKSAGFPSGKYLFAGVVDGRNIWADNLAASLSTLESLEAVVGKGKHSIFIYVIKIAHGYQMQYLIMFITCSDKLVVSTSCSLMHTAVDLVNETKLDDEIKSWLAFAAQKVVEVNALAKALAGQKDEVYMARFFIVSITLASISFLTFIQTYADL